MITPSPGHGLARGAETVKKGRRNDAIGWIVILLAILSILNVTACRHLPANLLATPSPTHTPTPTPTPTPVPPPPPATQPAHQGLNIVWWTPIWFSPRPQTPAGEFLAERLAQFEAAHPDIHVITRVMPPYGRGGIKDYILGAYKVAPSLLPDLVTVDMGDLRTFASLGIFQPLDTLLPQEVMIRFYPLARKSGTINDQLLALQFEADVYHLAYKQTALQAPPPGTWEALLNSRITYHTLLFDTEDEASDVVLLQYAAAGGTLPYEGKPPLNEQALLNIFNFYDQAYRRGIIPEESLHTLKDEDVWTALVEDRIPMVDTRARLYVQKGLQDTTIAAAPIPMWDGKPRALARGWGLGITTALPERRDAALQLLLWLMHEETLGPWSQKAGYIPTRSDILKGWSAPAQYTALMDQLLQGAYPYPPVANLPLLRHALAVGLHTLLVEGEAPEVAIQKAQEVYGR